MLSREESRTQREPRFEVCQLVNASREGVLGIFKKLEEREDVLWSPFFPFSRPGRAFESRCIQCFQDFLCSNTSYKAGGYVRIDKWRTKDIVILLPYRSAHEEREGWELRGSYDHISPKYGLDKKQTKKLRTEIKPLTHLVLPHYDQLNIFNDPLWSLRVGVWLKVGPTQHMGYIGDEKTLSSRRGNTTNGEMEYIGANGLTSYKRMKSSMCVKMWLNANFTL